MAKILMCPALGDRLLRHVGDRVVFRARFPDFGKLPSEWRACLRTNIGGGETLMREAVSPRQGPVLTDAAWRDIPLMIDGSEGVIEFVLNEAGFFSAKPFLMDDRGQQHWPEGKNVNLSVHPSCYRTGNTLYCAFARMFGETRFQRSAANRDREKELEAWDKEGWTVIPPSGKFRDLKRELPHIFQTLGCRILHLLPVSPTPTTYARLGRFGSPYASQNLEAVDLALAEFDRRSTGLDQFGELIRACHAHGGRVFLDVATNHTGWGSNLQENRPEWFLRADDGAFASPGAWGVVWQDLVELDHRRPELWGYWAEVFLTWCRRGVDGFRCDAGYKVPAEAWRHICARVHLEFPETVFLLEGLGGSWETTEALLTEGGMQWAYSELFQNYGAPEIARYVDYAWRQSGRVGLYVHYSETHDNDRLAAKGRAWSLLRNRLCALTSPSGAFGFTCGVEWLAAEKINVHSNRGLAWENADNIVPELARLNQLLSDHPCFFDGARLRRLSAADAPALAWRRDSKDGVDRLLILVNPDLAQAHDIELPEAEFNDLGEPEIDLLDQPSPRRVRLGGGAVRFTLHPGAAHCLAATAQPAGLAGAAYREKHTALAWAASVLSYYRKPEEIARITDAELLRAAEGGAQAFCAAAAAFGAAGSGRFEPWSGGTYPQTVAWRLADKSRVFMAPPGHWLVIEDEHPFRARLIIDSACVAQLEPARLAGRYSAAFAPRAAGAAATLHLERYGDGEADVEAPILFLGEGNVRRRFDASEARRADPLAAPVTLLTNGAGAMARICVNLGQVKSKYDCVLGANLNAQFPVDRHVLCKRIRIWAMADGFISPLDGERLAAFDPGPPAHWQFVSDAGGGRAVGIEIEAEMLPESNTIIWKFTRSPNAPAVGEKLPDDRDLRLTARLDLEDRNFHSETIWNPQADNFFKTRVRPAEGRIGFVFVPAEDRRLWALADAGLYHPQEEWSFHLAHPVEASRGQISAGDAFSPGWFEIPLGPGESARLMLSAEANPPPFASGESVLAARPAWRERVVSQAGLDARDEFGAQLAIAARAFVARRASLKTVIAGYPWFLDWGRDTLICARGLLAAGLADDVVKILRLFARFEDRGTLPNVIFGEDASNRDTSDAPLWFGAASEDAAEIAGRSLFQSKPPDGGRTIGEALRDIALGYLGGTPNGIRVDPASGLVWSPAHFTWMDTNFPAGSPRAGFPIEIQALWVRLLRLLAQLGADKESESWASLADRAQAAVERFFWIEEKGFYCDVVLADAGQPASRGRREVALRSNFLWWINFGFAPPERARRSVAAAAEYLIVPGALRTLAPLPVSPPLAIWHQGRLVNDPDFPYRGRYEGDEDTQRKPAYHNGAAWTWTFPGFCEALARAWNFQPTAVAAAKSYLRSMEFLLWKNCVGQIPEIVDGDQPHLQRGCDAQAWGVTEALRVWKLLSG